MKTDIDKILNYEEEYRRFISDGKTSGRQLVCRSPLRPDDNNPSFSINLDTGKWTDFATGESGNYITFRAEMDGTDEKTAYEHIMDEHGKTLRDELHPYTLEEYSIDKKLDIDFLRALGLSTKRSPQCSYLYTPYYDRSGNVVAERKRYADKHFKWMRGSKTALYGMDHLSEYEAAENGSVLVVEGESDAQSLWLEKFPAVGVPGASTFNAEMAAQLSHIPRIYIHVEPDTGGQTFFTKVVKELKGIKYDGKVYRFSCRDLDGAVKDPSDIHMKYSGSTHELLVQLLHDAEDVPMSSDTEVNVQDICSNAYALDLPLQLQISDTGWIVDKRGIGKMGEGDVKILCPTPMIISKYIRPIDSNEHERVEISWYNGRTWNKSIFERSVIAQSRTAAAAMSASGMLVNSENSKYVVNYLTAIAAANRDRIPEASCISALGWYNGKDGKPFGRFLPACDERDDLIPDPSDELRLDESVKFYGTSGTLDDWIAVVTPHMGSYAFRSMIAASFASVLLPLLHKRSFCLYAWRASRSGKTAALKAALSVWGDPDKTMETFNSTAVGLERTLSIKRHIPAGVDEKQLHNGDQNSIDNLIYMFGSGRSKARGAKNGGLQKQYTWCNTVIVTGEEPLSDNMTNDGANTRYIQVTGPQFDTEESASQMYTDISGKYGTAGREFIRRLRAEYIDNDNLSGLDEELKAWADMATSEISDGGKKPVNGAHRDMIAVLCLADSLASRWFFRDAEGTSIDLLVPLISDNADHEAANKDISAVNIITDWIISNRANFWEQNKPGGIVKSPEFGEIRERDDPLTGEISLWAYIIPSVLNNLLRKEGFNSVRTLKYMASKGIIEADTNGGRYSRMVRLHDSTLKRMISMHFADKGTEDDTGSNTDNNLDI